jgi:hypothetical protein
MKKFTQEEFNTLPIVDGVRQCPKGDYSMVRDFDGFCSFEEGSILANQYAFDDGASFGLECTFENNDVTRLGDVCFIFG